MSSALWTAIGLYVLFAGAMFVLQRRLMYLPQPYTATRPEDHRPDLKEIVCTAEDGVAVHHWILPAGGEDHLGVVVFHGNAGSLEGSAEKFLGLSDDGHGLVLANYRGYSGAAGRPTEKGLLADGRALLDRLEEENWPAGRLVLYGESLGSGVATRLASERRAAGLVLEAPFTSAAAVAQRHYWYLPAYWLTRDRFDNLSRIGEVGAPVLILHGARDRTVPVGHGRRLAERAGEACELAVYPGAGHADLFEHGAGERVREFLNRLEAAD